MRIFISHSSKDKNLIDQFVEKILILGCGLTDENIFCTSIDGLGIKTGEDFRDHIKTNLKISDYSFLMISDNYKNSEVCLNEMGASWALDGIKVKQFLFPKLGFNSLGLLLNIQQAAKLDDSSALDELYEELIMEFNTEKKVSRWNKHKSDFLKFLDSYSDRSHISASPSPEDFFDSFIKENASLNHILLKAYPTLIDCKAIFTEKYYLVYFEAVCKELEQLGSKYIEPMYTKRKFVRIKKANTRDLIGDYKYIAGGYLHAAKKGCFNYNIDFYIPTFLENENSEFGVHFSAFCFVNDRWVFIPNPARLVKY